MTRRPFRSTLKVALNGASHGTSTRQTGVTGPRMTIPVRPVVVVGVDPADAHAAIVVAAAEIAINTRCQRVIAWIGADLEVRLMVLSATGSIRRSEGERIEEIEE